MNKANVIPLVVVSSLLTYISTATQPAATAGFAQEKWEYFVGWKDRTMGPDFNGEVSTSISQQYPAGGVNLVISEKDQDSYRVEIYLKDGIESSLRSKSFSDKGERGRYSINAGKELLRLSGEYGWHVFQVTKRPEPDHPLYGQRGEIMHWRRRVQ